MDVCHVPYMPPMVFSNPVCQNIPLLSSCTSLAHSVFLYFLYPAEHNGNCFSADFTTFLSVFLFIRIATVRCIWKYKPWARQRPFNCLLLVWGDGVVVSIATLTSGLKSPYLFRTQSFENSKFKIQLAHILGFTLDCFDLLLNVVFS